MPQSHDAAQSSVPHSQSSSVASQTESASLSPDVAAASATAAQAPATAAQAAQAAPAADAQAQRKTETESQANPETKARKAEAEITHAGFDPQAWRQLLGPKHWGSWLALGLLAVCSYIPNRIRDALSWLLSWPLQHLDMRFRRIVFANLHTAFPEKSDSECRQLYRKILVQALVAAFSYGESVFLPRFMLKHRWQVFNQEALDWALNTKKPIFKH